MTTKFTTFFLKHVLRHKLILSCVTLAACTQVTPGLDPETDEDPHEDPNNAGMTGDGDGDLGEGPSPLGGTLGEGGSGPGDGDNTGGTSTDPLYPELERCFFAGDLGGMGGAPAGGGAVELKAHAFLGEVLAEGAGLTLYTYGGDSPGTCGAPPLSGCSADCAIAWPPFLADASLIGETLDSDEFGTFQRTDGNYQSTYRGWPLYLYKKDLAPADVNGQGKASIWHAASPRETEVMILRNSANEKFLVDSAGFTLYILADDTVGDAELDPLSACTGECRDSFAPFRGRHFSVVTSLNAQDFELFTSPHVGRQVAYRGHPLYLYVGDEKPFDANGLGEFGAEVALF